MLFTFITTKPPYPLMKFLSLRSLLQHAAAVIKRFPFEVLFALTGTLAACVNIEVNDHLNPLVQSWCWRLIMMANLGLLLSLSVTLFAESKALSKQLKFALRLAAAALAVVLMFTVNPYERSADAIRFFLLSLAFHLLVAFAAFINTGSVHAFWQFNKTIFLRILTSALYSGVLFAGISAAIAAMNFLFNFSFEWDTYVLLWVWIAGMFNTIFFLAGIPQNVKQLEADESYPKGLKIFTQFVLIPLASLYLVILLAYETKILLQWNLPKGMVSNLILGYAVFGILSLLLVFPIRNLEANKWIRTYSRSFYFLMMPLLVLLFLAVGARVFKYGITEYRYFLMVLALWLLFISVYFLVSARQNIKLIPITLCILTLLTIYGPQSAFKVSLFSQQRILEKIFERNKAYRDGILLPVDSNKISKKDGNRAVAQLNYLVQHGDLSALQHYFRQDLGKVTDSIARLKRGYGNLPLSKWDLIDRKVDWAKKQLHLDRFSGYENESPFTTDLDLNEYTIKADNDNVLAVTGYDYVIDMGSNTYTDTAGNKTTYQLNNTPIKLNNSTSYIFVVDINNQSATFNLAAIVDSIEKNNFEKFKDTTNSNRNGIHS